MQKKMSKDCGSLRCQRDSFARSLSTVVVSCNKSQLKGKNDSYEVVLEDTVLFPEGGGQPDDHGKLNDIEVHRVIRKGAKAVHFTNVYMEPGTSVQVELDWARRFDHMQQHSGQHLITAVADKEFGFKTKSWNLAIGEKNRCFIELDTPSVSPKQLLHIEGICNELIRKSVPMTPRWYSPQDPELEAVRSRGLPDDFEGSEVRVVEIEGLDCNMCCGTHIPNLSYLQCVKLLYTESKKGCTLLYYIVGNRVLLYTQRTFENERSLNKLLSVGLDEHEDAVVKMQKANKAAAKVSRNQLREIAQLIAFKHLNTVPLDTIACIHREDGDVEFMNIVANELTTKCDLVFLTVGTDRDGGQFLLAGREEAVVSTLGPKVAAILSAKGGGRKGRFQGKASKLDKRHEVEKLLRESVQASL